MSEPVASERSVEPKPPDTPIGRSSSSDPFSAMAPRFNLLFRGFAKRYFSHFDLDDATVARLRQLEDRGSVVYVMRYSSRLDYFLFNTLFAREGLRLSSFANGLVFYHYRPFLQALRSSFQRMRGRGRGRRSDREFARHLALDGQSFFLFLRTSRLRSFLRGKAAAKRSDELDLLEEVVRAVWDTDRPVFFVPLSLFWRKGPRTESRFLNLSYGSATRPSDLAKVSNFLANYSNLSVKVGEAIDLQRFMSEHQQEGVARVARKVRRSILIYLFREEKVVEGPTLKSIHRIQREVLDDPRVREAIRVRTGEKKWSEERGERQAEKFFNEIAARMNSTFLAVLNTIMNAFFRRMFASIEIIGLEKVAASVKDYPVVLVPSHRSYFDFLILSVMLYSNYMTPPHIAARENMAFGPFGYVFRRAGAFFMRKTFSDPLYKEVFRSYVGYLVREGFTQEFFIEGGRSRTGKTLAPRLGMLSWDVEAFIASHKRDLVFIPVAITYERLVEESAMVDELEGGEKTEESVLGLMRARKYLQRRFGTAHVRFGEPISLAEALGEDRERFRACLQIDSGADEARDKDRIEPTILPPAHAELREAVEKLGWNIVERINWTMVANATSVAACVMMGASHRGLRREEVAMRMQQIVDLLRLQDTRLTKALIADEGAFDESITFMLRSDLLKSVGSGASEIIYFDESRRVVLDIYRNALGHFLAAPSFLARRILGGATRRELAEDLANWLDLFYQEFIAPHSEHLEDRREAFLAHFEARRWITEDPGGMLVPTDDGRAVLESFAEQTRSVIDAYRVCCDVAAELDEPVSKKEFCELAASRFGCAELLGEAARRESANDTTFSNALDLLVRRGAIVSGSRDLKTKKGKPPRQERVFSPAPEPGALERLQATLALADLP